jgi:cation diffusion facilitator family transporter
VTVWVALLADLGVAIAKLAAGVATGSSSMLAESAHSLADGSSQALLLVGIRTSRRGADRTHPFGHGMARYLWTLLVSVLIFAVGGLFSVFEGVTLIRGESADTSRYALNYSVLVIAAALGLVSLGRAMRQLEHDADRVGATRVRLLLCGKDPVIKTVLLTDAGSLIGLLIAACGIALHQATGNAAFDGAASIAIGVLLGAVAIALAFDSAGLLLGEAAGPYRQNLIREAILENSDVEAIRELLTMYVGPDMLLVASRVTVRDTMSVTELERLADEIERAVQTAIPEVREFSSTPPHDRLGENSRTNTGGWPGRRHSAIDTSPMKHVGRRESNGRGA